MAAICGVVARRDASERLADIISRQCSLGEVTSHHDGPIVGFAAQGQQSSADRASVLIRDHLTIALHSGNSRSDELLDFLVRHWDRDSIESLGRCQVDFAACVWDARTQAIYLARAPLSSFGLAYRVTRDEVWFSTVAAALSQGSGPNLDWLAINQGGGAVFGAPQTAFADVSLVEPGTAVTIKAGEVAIRRWWHARVEHSDQPGTVHERLRASLDQAVRDAIDGVDGPIGTHLSGGRDSGAVTATAALALKDRGNSLIALTSVTAAAAALPNGPICADEGPSAAALSRLHSNIQHRPVVTRQFALGAKLDQVNRLLPGPHGMAINLPWWSTIHDIAQEHGVRMMLTGLAGNLTISAGGPWAIVDLVGRDFVGWARAILAAGRVPESSWKNLLGLSFGPYLPSPLFPLLRRVSGRARHQRGRFLGGGLRERVMRASVQGDQRPPRHWQAARLAALEQWDGADPSNEPVHGMIMRDPTADIRVVEAALAIGQRDLASPYDRRPVYEQAFADRVPPSTLRPRYRGLQAADWPAAIDPVELAAYFETVAESRSVQEMVDVEAVRRALRHWPTGPVGTAQTALYGDELLPAISLASFAHIHWSG